MKLFALTLASFSLLASAPVLADPTKLREDVRAVAPALEKYARWHSARRPLEASRPQPARPQHRHARRADHAQSDRRDG